MCLDRFCQDRWKTNWEYKLLICSRYINIIIFVDFKKGLTKTFIFKKTAT